METITKKEIENFLNNFCEKVRKNESESYAELMMDDHKCIEYKGKLYYIPEDNSLYDEFDEDIYDYLIDNFLY